MPISEGRISPEERRKRRLTANPAVNETYQQLVVGVTFFPKPALLPTGTINALCACGQRAAPISWKRAIRTAWSSQRRLYPAHRRLDHLDQMDGYIVPRRYAITQIPAETKLQVSAFLKSDQLEAIAPLTTTCRKNIASNIDITIITDTAWRGQLRFYTNGMRIQFVFVTALLAMSGDRPGAVIEAQSYRGTNQALKWKDIKWVVVPNPSDPQHPHVHAVIRGTILKGFRLTTTLNSANSFSTPNPTSTVPFVPFPLLCSSIPPEHIHHPSTRPEVADLPAVRAEEYIDQTWSISASQALRYEAYMDKLQMIAKMEGMYPRYKVTPYCIWRGALEHFKRDLPDDVRERMSGHVPMSQKFFKDYQSTLIRADLGAVLHKRDKNIQVTNAVKRSMAMSANRDVNAPLRLSLAGTQKLYDEPELAQLRDKEAELDKEYIRRSQQERVEFFDNASKRQLLGVAPWKPIAMNLTRETSPTANTLSFAPSTTLRLLGAYPVYWVQE
ncbi:uncharacterized protein ARMOST_03787 [Armillaria ostoyae]|uniref:Uncharacterized protein n=1 Tax=Armillaria ostoyae TaxID=47428 RepID=A0A284QVG4_ARMOS|nr:uncharacterized protein ARMOST_03787 [Armillaria ostoyae]